MIIIILVMAKLEVCFLRHFGARSAASNQLWLFFCQTTHRTDHIGHIVFIHNNWKVIFQAWIQSKSDVNFFFQVKRIDWNKYHL